MKTIDNQFAQLKDLIHQHQRIVLTSHINADGDSIGSVLALYHYLQSLGKQAVVLIPGEVPPKYQFLDTQQIINRLNRAEALKAIDQAGLIIITDVSSLTRLDVFYRPVKASKATKVCIDHHPFKARWIDLSIVDTQRVATGELIYQFFKYCGIPLNREIARALYTAILSDSGSFRFQRTDAFTFQMAAELVQLGIEPAEMYGHVYENGNQSQLKAWGHILSNLQSKGQIAWLVVDNRIMKNFHISLEEIEGIIDIIRKDREAMIVLVFVEKADAEILVGLRSKNGFDVGSLARQFGGGGHYNAAGFTAHRKLDEVVEETIEAINQIIKE